MDQMPQPVSMHDTPHSHHGALPLITAMLGVFIVIESVVLGYVVKEYVMEDEAGEAVVDNQPVVAVASSLPPLVYSPYIAGRYPAGQQLIMIDRETGAETVLQEIVAGVIGVVAVPQVGFDGRIFISVMGEGDNPGLGLSVLDLETPSASAVSVAFADKLPFVGREATKVSPDQTSLAALYYNPAMNELSREVAVWNLLTGQREVLGKIADTEAFTPTLHGLGGSSGYELSWTSQDCVSAYVYTLSSTGDDNSFAGAREFCR
ncbi:MAG: hypothetical protein WAZ14_04105 [Patescibacteria group bacterium]